MSDLEKCLLESVEEARELYIPESVPRIKECPTAFEFHRKWVAPNRPFVIEGGASHWPAVKKWSSGYFRKTLPEKEVTVAVTPNGYADAVADGKFVMPEERQMKFSSFLDIIDGKTEDTDVFYIQKQNSNMTTDFRELLPDLKPDIAWTSDAFGSKPDAVNFWMGQDKAVTSIHKDHYENLYAVISGEKEFRLHPPLDRPFIPHRSYPQAKYRKVDGNWVIEDIPGSNPIPWICIDPLNPDFETYPMYRHSKMLKCTVRAGDLFYLPALWFHHVTQTDCTIAVNYWYDMEFDTKYGFFHTLDKLSTMMLSR